MASNSVSSTPSGAAAWCAVSSAMVVTSAPQPLDRFLRRLPPPCTALDGHAADPALLDVRPRLRRPHEPAEPVALLDDDLGPVGGLDRPVRAAVDVALNDLGRAAGDELAARQRRRLGAVEGADLAVVAHVVPRGVLDYGLACEVPVTVGCYGHVGLVGRVDHVQRVPALGLGLQDAGGDRLAVPGGPGGPGLDGDLAAAVLHGDFHRAAPFLTARLSRPGSFLCRSSGWNSGRECRSHRPTSRPLILITTVAASRQARSCSW